MSGIRLKKSADIGRTQPNSSGDLVVQTTTSGVNCALWRRKMNKVVGSQGDAYQVTATAFVPSGTDVQRRDLFTVDGEDFTVVNVIPADDDRGTVDHIGLELEDT